MKYTPSRLIKSLCQPMITKESFNETVSRLYHTVTIRLKNKYNNIKMEANKICSKCQIEKSLTEFYKDKYQKSGYRPSCKMCLKIQMKELQQIYSRLETREEKDKKVCYRCKEERNIREYSKNRCCKDGFDGECKCCKNKYKKAYIKARIQYDPEFRLLNNMRSRLGGVLKGKSKSQTTKHLIGIDFKIFTKWIEYQFEEGMTLENYGSAWCHDHVLPISSF